MLIIVLGFVYRLIFVSSYRYWYRQHNKDILWLGILASVNMALEVWDYLVHNVLSLSPESAISPNGYSLPSILCT